MSFVGNKAYYLEILHRFLEGSLSPEDFKDKHMFLWRQDRDEGEAMRNTWPVRYDVQMEQKVMSGELSSEDFSQQWAELWGYAGEIAFIDLVDTIFSACDRYHDNNSPYPIEPEHEYTAEQFRDYVNAAFKQYQVDVAA